MSNSFLFKDASVVNEGKTQEQDVLVENGIIAKIGNSISTNKNVEEINASGLHLLPGVIDDQVHFREPGFTHKAEIATESRAAVAGGTTTFMEMPNTNPQSTNQEELQKKYDRAAACSPANYSFFFGATNDNLEEVKKVDPKTVCGVKIFMGSSTGNMLVDKEKALEGIFQHSPTLIATHCEDEETIRANSAIAQEQFGQEVPMSQHPIIRSREACIISSKFAIGLAKKFDSRLHILHISTAEEPYLFDNSIPLKDKRITSEVCVHHMWFCDDQYDTLGSKIKCNPAIKTKADRAALLKALKEGYLDIIATDHAPHTIEEKSNSYFKAPSGLPLVQHSLLAMLDFVHKGDLSLEFVVEKMCHAPAECFQVAKRGFIREGYQADLVLADLHGRTSVTKDNLYYKCGWSPFEGHQFQSKIKSTYVNGELVYDGVNVLDKLAGQRLTFDR